MGTKNDSTPRFNLYDQISSSSSPAPPSTEPGSPSSSNSLATAGVVMRRRQTSENDPSSLLMDFDEEESLETTAAVDGEEVPDVGTAFFDYTANYHDELSFQRGSVVEILNKDCGEQGWIYAKIGENEGMIPENYVRLVGRQLNQIPRLQLKTHVQIGEGFFSKVYKGKWGSKDVALKIPKLGTQSEKEKIIEVLKREALIYARLKHRNVVGFHGICLEEPCLVLELCEGGTLYRLLNRELSYSIPIRVVHWALQIAKGMEHLHNQDDALVHADLKSENVLIKEIPCLCDHQNTPRPLSNNNFNTTTNRCNTCDKMSLDSLTLKLTDFNISRTENSTRHSFAGTNRWMAPEVFRGESRHTKKSDVYSYGLVVLELVTNQKPFPDVGDANLFILIANNHMPIIPDDCPESLAQLMRECWNPDPDQRPSFTEIIKIIEKMKNTQRNSTDSTRKLDYRNSEKLVMHEKDIQHIQQLKKELGSRNLYTIQNLPTQTPPKTATRSTKNRAAKINKNEIGNPTGFMHILTVHDNQKEHRSSPSDQQQQRYQVECPVNNGDAQHQAVHSTLPRNYKHLATQPLTDFPRSTPNFAVNGATLASRLNKSSNPLPGSTQHGQKRFENEGYNDDHLVSIPFGPPLKTAKSNPELAGPNSLLKGKTPHSKPNAPLGRSNATRKRNIEPDSVHASKSSSDTNSTLSSVVVEQANTSDLMDRPPIFRDSQQQRGRNQSESSPAFDSTTTTSRQSSSSTMRAKKGASIFYVDEDLNNDSSSFSLSSSTQDSQMGSGKKRSGIRTFFKNLLPSTSGGDLESDALVCDRPQLPIHTCVHPNHSKIDPLTGWTHLCALTETEMICEELLMMEPEIQQCTLEAACQQQQQHYLRSEARNSPRAFIKHADDPQHKRHAKRIVTTNGGSRSTVSAQVVAKHKYRQSTSVSENEDQNGSDVMMGGIPLVEATQNMCYEPVRPSSSSFNSTPQPSNYSRVSSPPQHQFDDNYSVVSTLPASSSMSNYSQLCSALVQSDTDLRHVGIADSSSFLDAPASIAHQRSKSSDAQPNARPNDMMEDSIMDWSVGPISNRAYVPLQDSIYKKVHARTPSESVSVVEEEVKATPMDVSEPPTSVPPPPIPPPRYRPVTLGPTANLPPATTFDHAHQSPNGINWRLNPRSPSETRAGASPHRKKNFLEREVIGISESSPQLATTPPSALTPPTSLPPRGRHTPEPSRRYNLNTPVSGSNFASSSTTTTPMTPSSEEEQVELYEAVTNPSYRSQLNQTNGKNEMAPPAHRAPPLPSQLQPTTVPKYLPKTRSQFNSKRPSPQPTKFM